MLSSAACGALTVAVYHGCDPKWTTEQKETQRLKNAQARADWNSGAAQVMVATISFGMGVDKSDVRVVCNYDAPGDS